jgi:hypothetical protein
MNVEIRTEAAQFPQKEYINGIFLAVWDRVSSSAVALKNRLTQLVSHKSQKSSWVTYLYYVCSILRATPWSRGWFHGLVGWALMMPRPSLIGPN